MGLRGSPTLNFDKNLQRAKLINTWCSNYCLLRKIEKKHEFVGFN